MKHTFFEIHNFKGIREVRLEINATPKSKVYTLIGLNESGKTTILEAINFLSYRTDLDPLNLPGYAVKDVHELIPIGSESNFNDKIVIKAGFELDDDDENKISAFAIRYLGHSLSQKIGSFEITQSYTFKNSKLVPNQRHNTWQINLVGKPKRARQDKHIVGENLQKMIGFITTLLPGVLYFPNFLFEFPDRIYLEDAPSDEAKHNFYRTIFQDVLDAIGEGANLNDHILQRAKTGNTFDRKHLDAVLLKMGANITATVFKGWNRIFKRSVGNKEIVVSIAQDEAGHWYLELKLKDAHELYTISQRSLGFRWFFTFLLLTQYRGFRKNAPKNTLFLLDEPASNLHPSAQTQLLDSFGNLSGDASIIYTTHSHHMINPNWLEGAFVVKNEGLNYDDDQDNYNARKTVVVLHKYRQFAAAHPNQATYFQPVLDVLDYSPGRLENVPHVVMLEGKNDFYTLKFFQQALGYPSSLYLLPGTGAGSLVEVIRLYLAWGRDFIILLDSDHAGVIQKKRYIELFGAIVEDRIFSLADVDNTWNRKGMEYLIDEADRTQLQQLVYPKDPHYKKMLLNRALQELFLTQKQVTLSVATQERFKTLIDFCAGKLRVDNQNT